MHPAVTATAIVVGAIAAVLFYVFNEQPKTHGNYSSKNKRPESSNNVRSTNTTNHNDHDERPPKAENESKYHTKQRKTDMIKNDDKCGLCLEDKWVEFETLPCNHAFHAKCLEDYHAFSRRDVRCPTCGE